VDVSVAGGGVIVGRVTAAVAAGAEPPAVAVPETDDAQARML
jgi:hypothetical protein